MPQCTAHVRFISWFKLRKTLKKNHEFPILALFESEIGTNNNFNVKLKMFDWNGLHTYICICISAHCFVRTLHSLF